MASTYSFIIDEITTVATSIPITKSGGDGRIDSAVKEIEFLTELSRQLLERNPGWNITIPSTRYWYDIEIENILINLKISSCKSADNCMNKKAVFYSITGEIDYPGSSNWNKFYDELKEAHFKKERDRMSEYHYLVKNKDTGALLLKSIFDIHTYHPNSSNNLQINWKNEFKHLDYFTEDIHYIEKVKELLKCIQQSVIDMTRLSEQFAMANIGDLFSSE